MHVLSYNEKLSQESSWSSVTDLHFTGEKDGQTREGGVSPPANRDVRGDPPRARPGRLLTIACRPKRPCATNSD
jgi:hypothetical protein